MRAGGSLVSNAKEARAQFFKRKRSGGSRDGLSRRTRDSRAAHPSESFSGRAPRLQSTEPSGTASVYSACGEMLRSKYIRKVYENAGFVVVNDDDDGRSQGKWMKGQCNVRLKILGTIIDLSDPERPTI